MLPDLPHAVADMDIGDWANLAPEQLILRPALLSNPPALAAARALKYSRIGSSNTYDEIGFRIDAATPRRDDVVPLQTIPGMQLARQWSEASQQPLEIEALMDEHAKLRHRPIDLPYGEADRFRYQIERRHMHFKRARKDAKVQGEEEVWTFPITAPPKGVMEMAASDDERLIFAQHYRIEIPGAYWLPLSRLIAAGRFRRMQEWREILEPNIVPNRFYCFISHRWLSPTHPDPDTVQAAFIAWQMFAYLCEAIRIAHTRGLHEPRKFSHLLGIAVGVAGSNLAEALLVNVLRPALDPQLLDSVWEEVVPVEELVEDYGVAAAKRDIGLQNLRDLVAGLPIVGALLERIFLWYDYACMPQSPRTPDDEKLFRDGIEHLPAMQLVGRTAILLDEAEDYLSRGWCSLEALVADTMAGTTDLLVGSARRAAAKGLTEHYFETLLMDRPHFLWRAVLDTEVFRIQTAAQCMERLSLGVTDSRDVPFIYQGFVGMPAPTKIHTGPSELVTGVFPLPVIDGSAVLVPLNSGRAVQRANAVPALYTLDWTDARLVGRAWNEIDRADAVASFLSREPLEGGRPSGHIAVVASCEGEAVLLANWVWNRLDQLEAVVGARIGSLSWLATDIAPVGHFVDGTLRAVPVQADVWVLVTMSARFMHCQASTTIRKTIAATNVRGYELSVDQAENNVSEILPSSQPNADEATRREERESFRKLELATVDFPVYAGGLFRGTILERLWVVKP